MADDPRVKARCPITRKLIFLNMEVDTREHWDTLIVENLHVRCPFDGKMHTFQKADLRVDWPVAPIVPAPENPGDN